MVSGNGHAGGGFIGRAHVQNLLAALRVLTNSVSGTIKPLAMREATSNLRAGSCTNISTISSAGSISSNSLPDRHGRDRRAVLTHRTYRPARSTRIISTGRWSWRAEQNPRCRRLCMSARAAFDMAFHGAYPAFLRTHHRHRLFFDKGSGSGRSSLVTSAKSVRRAPNALSD